MGRTPTQEKRPDRVRKGKDEQGISVQVPRVVTGRRNEGARVQYPERGGWSVPETIVLERWRRRRSVDGTSFHGFRLPPQVFHAAARCGGCRFWRAATVEDVASVLTALTREDPHLGFPSASNLLLLIRHVDEHPGALAALLDRHRVRKASPGVPDLFLYRQLRSGRPCGGLFVEVKKPSETVYRTQTCEIKFLRDRGLRAGVLRLIERW